MKSAAADKVERIKWWDALDTILEGHRDEEEVAKGLQMARECQHEDAKWLASLFPADEALAISRMREVLLVHQKDARAVFIAWALDDDSDDNAPLLRAAEMGYALAQAVLSWGTTTGEDKLAWAEKAAAQGNRQGLFQLGDNLLLGRVCEKDEVRAVALFKEAAELGDADAQLRFGEVAFGAFDWERFHWWALAASRGRGANQFVPAMLELVELFEAGKHGRILAEVAPAMKGNLDVANGKAFRFYVGSTNVEKLEQVVVLYQVCLARARQAIVCWSMVGVRLGVMKDVRVMIAQVAWTERWRWAEVEDDSQKGVA